jgi:hypothetical protein
MDVASATDCDADMEVDRCQKHSCYRLNVRNLGRSVIGGWAMLHLPRFAPGHSQRPPVVGFQATAAITPPEPLT